MNNRFSNLIYIEPKRGSWMSTLDSVRHSILPGAKSPRARRPETKSELEFRQAALFALARASLTGDATLKFAMVPEVDDSVDTVFRTGSDPYRYECVQLKEIVPGDVDPQQTLESLLESLRRRYGTGETLSIAIHLNRNLVTTLGSTATTSLPAITFWLFGLCARNRGFVVRDPFATFEVYEFDIPNPPSSITQW